MGEKAARSLRVSDRPEKKYQVWDAAKGRWVHFGAMGYEDYTKHRDPKRRRSYLSRSGSIRGSWRSDQYSANNLARNLLW